MRLLEGDKEEVKGGKRLKALTLNQQLTRLSVLLEQTKAGNNSYKLKKRNNNNISIRKLPKRFTSHYNKGRTHWKNKLVGTIVYKNFQFYLPKDAGNITKHEIDSIIKHNEPLAEHAIKNEIRQLLSKY